MKNIYELANLTPTEVEAITPKVIAETIEEIRRHKRVWGQLFNTNKDLIKSGGKQIEFPKKGSGVTVYTNMSAGDSITASAITYSSVTVQVKKHGVGISILGDAIRQTNVDVIAHCLKEAGEAFSDAMDKLAFETLFPVQTFSSGTGEAVTTTSIIVGVKSATNATSLTLAATGSTIAFSSAGSLTAWVAPSNAVAAVGTTSTVTTKDILSLKAAIQAEKYDPDVVVMNHARLTDVIYDSNAKFLDAWAYRGEGPLLNGEIGTLFGMKVVVTGRCPYYGVVVADTKSIGYEVIRKPLELAKDEYTGMAKDALNFYGFAEMNYGVINDMSYGVVVPAGTFSIVTTTL